MAASMSRVDVIVGCYERSIIGYSLIKNNTEDYVFEMKFTNNSHTGCVKAIASTSNFLASGSTDEMIQLYNLKTNCELGSLMHHKGSVTCLCFHDKHMVSCSDDGSICIWSTKDWDCHKVLRGHKSEVRSVAVHPSGKLAMSVGKDKTLRTWNLVQGRSAYITNLKAVADCVLWNPSGTKYLVAIDDRVDVYSLETAKIVSSYKFTGKIISVALIQDDYIVIGGEGEMIEIFKADETNPACLCRWKAHDNRVKAIQSVQVQASDSSSYWLFTASSDGYIKAWTINVDQITNQPHLIAAVDTTARLTCLTVRTPKNVQSDDSKSMNKESECIPQNKSKTKRKSKVEKYEKSEESKTKLEETDNAKAIKKKRKK